MYVSMGGVSDCNIAYISVFLFLLQIEQQYPEALEVWMQLERLFSLLLTLLKSRTGTAGTVSRTRIRFVVQNLMGSLLHPLEKVPDNFMTLLVSIMCTFWMITKIDVIKKPNDKFQKLSVLVVCVCVCFVFLECVAAFNAPHSSFIVQNDLSLVHWWGRFPPLPEDIFGGGGLPNVSVPAAVQILPELRVSKIRWKQWVMYMYMCIHIHTYTTVQKFFCFF